MDENEKKWDEQRRKFADDLGLVYLRTLPVVDSMVNRIVMFNWPRAANGSSNDRTVLMTVYDDGSFATALDDGRLKVTDAQAQLRAMVKVWEKGE